VLVSVLIVARGARCSNGVEAKQPPSEMPHADGEGCGVGKGQAPSEVTVYSTVLLAEPVGQVLAELRW
jgi:hypothetical protein